MLLEILVLGGDQRVAQHLGKIVVAVDHAPLQRELPDHAVLVVVELRDGAGAIVLELGHLRQVGGVDQDKAADCAGGRGEYDQQNEERIANQLESDTARLLRGIGCDGRFFVNALHGRLRQNSIEKSAVAAG